MMQQEPPGSIIEKNIKDKNNLIKKRSRDRLYQRKRREEKRQEQEKIKCREARKTQIIDLKSMAFNKDSGLEQFIEHKIMTREDKTKPKRIDKWGSILEQHLRVTIHKAFHTEIGEKPRRTAIGEEIEKERKYTINFLKTSSYKKVGEWINLYEIKKSCLPKANMGLFTLQPFKAGDLMGVYFGDEILTVGSEAKSCYAMKSNFHLCVVDCMGGIDSNYRAFFGLQFANDPLQSKNMERVQTRNDSNRYTHNFFVDDRLMARACHDIQIGEELFLNYGWKNKICNCVGCQWCDKQFV